MKKIVTPYGFKAYSGSSYVYYDKVGFRGDIYLNGISGCENLQYVVSVSMESVTAHLYKYIRAYQIKPDFLMTRTSFGIANSIQDAFNLFTKLRALNILHYAECFVPLYESNSEFEVIASLIPYTSVDNIDIVLNALAPVADRYGEAIAMGIHRKEELGLYSQDNQNSLLL